MKAWRVFWVGGRIAYRALFNWISPWSYIPTMFGGTLFTLLFFTYLGRYAHEQDDSFFVVGNAIWMSSIASVYGSIMAISNERFFGTLGPLLATPANRLALFAGRAVPYIGNGLVISAFGFAASYALLDFHPAARSLPPLAAAVVVSVLSCTAFGMLLGSVGLRTRDVFFIGNSAAYLLMLLSGANVPLRVFPAWLRTISQGMPLTHGIEAGRAIVGGASLAGVGGLLARELAVAGCYAVAAYVLFRLLELEGRRRATLEII